MRAYLAEFLSDHRVVPLPRFFWLPVLYGLVLPRRSKAAAEKYREIWLPEGSPLRVYTSRQAELLADKLQLPVAYAMRYGEPSVASTLPRLEDPVVIPLYPQYADSTTGSVLDVLPRDVRVVGDFHDHPKYIAALGENVRRHWGRHGKGPLLLISFHGLPKKGAEIYEKQCRRTAELLAKNLGLNDREWRLVFQSRFGYAKWLEPYADVTLSQLPREGVERVDVVCPGFVADCLETLEELGLRGRETFIGAGGREFHLIACLNESPEWIAALVTIAREGAGAAS